MKKTFTILKIVPEEFYMEVEYAFGDKKLIHNMGIPTITGNKFVTDPKEIIQYLSSNYPIQLISQEQEEEGGPVISEEILSLVGNSLEIEDPKEEEITASGDLSLDSIYGPISNIIATKHIILDTLKELDLIK